MNYTNEQLKQALAKMLPEKLIYATEDAAGFNALMWRTSMPRPEDEELECAVLDTELLHLCWLVEETLSEAYSRIYTKTLCNVAEWQMKPFRLLHATWQQRTAALAKTLGVNIV